MRRSKGRGQIAPAVEVQIHREEREIARHIDAAEALVELDAVENVHLLAREMDVPAAQIAVAIEDASLGAATAKQRGLPRVEMIHVKSDRLERRARNERAGQLLRLREILVRAQPQLLDASPLGNLRRRLLRAVEGAELDCEALQIVRGDGTTREAPIQESFLRQHPHLHRVIDQCLPPRRMQRSVATRDRHDAEIHIAAQAADSAAPLPRRNDAAFRAWRNRGNRDRAAS